MPSFGSPHPVDTFGPLIKVRVTPSSWSQIVDREFNVPDTEPVDVLAMLDTGASTTAISGPLVSRLSLSPVRLGRVRGVESNTYRRTLMYGVDLDLGQGVSFRNVVVHGIQLGDHAYDILFGRDLLRCGTLLYEGRERRFRFDVPER